MVQFDRTITAHDAHSLYRTMFVSNGYAMFGYTSFVVKCYGHLSSTKYECQHHNVDQIKQSSKTKLAIITLSVLVNSYHTL